MTLTATFEYPGENGEYHHADGVLKQLLTRESANWLSTYQPLEPRRERSGYQEHADGTLTPKGLEKRNAHLAAIEGQNQVIRDRNATIARLQAQLSEYAAQLESVYEANAFPFKPLRDLQRRVGEANAAKGFHRINHFEPGPDDAAIADYATARLALITTEVAEAIEELRHGRAVDETYYPSAPYVDEDGSVVNAFAEEPFKPEGVPSELADVVIRAFDFAHEFGIDLAAMIDEKISYNQTREYRHGKEF